MKSNRGYIITSLIAQMIIIPIVLTAGIITASGASGKFYNQLIGSGIGKNAVWSIYILISFFASFVIGGIIGFTFFKLSKDKPDSAKVRYLVSILPIIYALIFAVLASIFSKGNYNSGWWGIYVLKNPFCTILDAGLALSGFQFIIPIAEISGYCGFISGIFIEEHISKTSIENKNARTMKIVFAALLSAFIVFTCINSRDIINNGIIELKYGKSTIGNDLTEFDLIKIAPFKENNNLARLSGRASFQFTEFKDMPRLDGATAAYPVYAAFVQAVYKGLGDYYETNKDNSDNKDIFSAFVSSNTYPLNIVKCSKTIDAYENLINGAADIIFTAEPSEAQVEKLKAKGDEFVLTPIGSEAFVFFTNIKNPVDNLSIDEIQDIYSGKVTNWSQVGGENKSILPYQRPEDSGSQTIMQNKVMKGIKILKPTKETYAGGMGEIISEVASYKNARNSIGYSFMYYSSSMINSNQIKYISVDGIKPDKEVVRSRKYPFTVPVYAVTLKSNSNKNVKKLIEWILSDEGQNLIEKTGYTPVK